MAHRMSLDQIGVGSGKKARLHRILFRHGLGNGTAVFLPYDQGLEHGPRDFFANPAASDPRYIIKLALEGGFNGIALQIGLAEKFYWDFAGEVPLILKLNGKTEIPSDEEALSPLHATVADAVRLGADAVGYTLYVGTPAQEADFAQLRTGSCRRARPRDAAGRLGVPSRRSHRGKGRQGFVLRRGLRGSDRERARRRRRQGQLPASRQAGGSRGGVRRGVLNPTGGHAVVRSANRTLVLISGGERAGDDAMVEKARQSMEAGATGLIFGRNVWQREHDESLRFVAGCETSSPSTPAPDREAVGAWSP